MRDIRRFYYVIWKVSVEDGGSGYGDALFCDMLWSDPREYRGGDDDYASVNASSRVVLTGVEVSPRGCGVLWGSDVSRRWLVPIQPHFNPISTPFLPRFNPVLTPFQPHLSPISRLVTALG